MTFKFFHIFNPFFLNIFDGSLFGLYTAKHENIFKVLYKTVDYHIHNLAVGLDRFGLDGSNYVYDEVFAELRH